MTPPKLSAVAIGFFLGFVLPYAIFVLLGYLSVLISGEEMLSLPPLLNVFGLVIAFGSPLAGGYLAARAATVQPLLHGLAVGVLGSIMFAFIGPPAAAAGFAIFVFMPGGIAGGWLWKIRGKGDR